MITAKQVKELRDKTGVGMMKCKEALNHCNGDIEAAVDFLRQQGLASADKRAGRATSQGLVVPTVAEDKRSAAIVEANCETDFVAKTDDFINFAKNLSTHLLNSKSVKTLADFEKSTINGQTVDDYRKGIIAKTGENTSIKRVERLEIAEGKFGLFETYIHNEGKLAVVIQAMADKPEAAKAPELEELAHEVALQVAAMNPIALSPENITQEAKTREFNVAIEKTKAEQVEKAVKKALEKAGINPAHVDSEDHMRSNTEKGWITKEQVEKAREIIKTVSEKTAASFNDQMIHKIAEGRLNKFFKENCLLEQAYVKDDSKTIKALCEEYSKKAQAKLEIAAYRRWAVGEELEAEPEEKQAEAC